MTFISELVLQLQTVGWRECGGNRSVQRISTILFPAIISWIWQRWQRKIRWFALKSSAMCSKNFLPKYWLVVIFVNPTAVWKTCAFVKLPNRGYLEGSCTCSTNVCRKALVILYLLLNASLMNPDWLRPAILHLVLSQRHPRTHFWNKQEISLFDLIFLGHENQGRLYK